METIANLDKLIARHKLWEPRDVAYIKSITLTGDYLQLTCLSQTKRGVKIWPDNSEGFIELVIGFENISKLKIAFDTIPLQLIAGFNILDLSESGLENINFEIEDYEDGRISFFCKHIVIEDFV